MGTGVGVGAIGEGGRMGVGAAVGKAFVGIVVERSSNGSCIVGAWVACWMYNGGGYYGGGPYGPGGKHNGCFLGRGLYGGYLGFGSANWVVGSVGIACSDCCRGLLLSGSGAPKGLYSIDIFRIIR